MKKRNNYRRLQTIQKQIRFITSGKDGDLTIQELKAMIRLVKFEAQLHMLRKDQEGHPIPKKITMDWDALRGQLEECGWEF